MQFTVLAYVNVATDPEGRSLGFFGYKPEHQLAHVSAYTSTGTTESLRFQVKAADNDPRHAAEQMFPIGNRMGCDLHGLTWPSDVRSMSVGDVVRVITPPCNKHPEGTDHWFACASVGWDEITAPNTAAFVRLEGTVATSRL